MQKRPLHGYDISGGGMRGMAKPACSASGVPRAIPFTVKPDSRSPIPGEYLTDPAEPSRVGGIFTAR